MTVTVHLLLPDCELLEKRDCIPFISIFFMTEVDLSLHLLKSLDSLFFPYKNWGDVSLSLIFNLFFMS